MRRPCPAMRPPGGTGWKTRLLLRIRYGRASSVWLPLFVAGTFALASAALAQPPVIFLVRHAERAAISGHVPSDTGLSSEGRARAEALAQALKDAQITAIYTTEYKRTKRNRRAARPVVRHPAGSDPGRRPQVVGREVESSPGKCTGGRAFQYAAANHQRARSLLSRYRR